MRGDSKPLLKFMKGSNRMFVIPVYQRNYDWKKENCQQLINDLIDVVDNKRPSHFFGSLVSYTDGNQCIIIDGQQRLTTVSLLLLALSNLIEDKIISYKQEQLSQRLKEDYLIDRWQPEERKIKLKPVKNDMKAFNALFSKDSDKIPESNITQNYLFLYERIRDSGLLAEDLFDAVSKLTIIDITLERGDDPQLIFESLNSTGLDLSEADKIRNYILMGLEHDFQKKMYEQYWNKIEERTDYEVSDFIRQYLTLKLGRWPNINNVYREYKQYVMYSNLDTESLLADLLLYADFHKQIRYASTGIGKIDTVLKRISLLEMSVINPFLFALLGLFKQRKIDEDGMCSVLLALESYLFRRLVCEVSTNSLNKIFATLNNDALKLNDDNESSYPEIVIYLLLQKKASGRFPTDAEFENSVRTRDFYNMRTKNKIYYFNRLENGDSHEILNIPDMMSAKENGLSVEHIMPQTLTEAWKKDLGSNYAKIHETWKNRIANLTLTAYNSNYSNRQFQDKLLIPNGFKDSPLPLNRWIGQQTKWTLEELESRCNIMSTMFIKLWAFPKTTFVPKTNPESQYYLNDDFDFTGSTIVSYTFMGTRYPVSTWKDAAEGILSQLCDLDPAGMHQIESKSEFSNGYISTNRDSRNGWIRIGHDLYAYLSTSTSAKIRILEDIFSQLELDNNELCFEIKSE